MGKDPAFLFYPSDWVIGTEFMSKLEKGCYIDLLCMQFNHGSLTLDMIKISLGEHFDLWEKLSIKFKKTNQNKFYNDRLKKEQEKRKAYSESRRKNAKNNGLKKKHMHEHMGKHMENRNRNINITLFSYKKAVERIYKLYPSRCVVSGRRLDKGNDNKTKIEKILKTKKYPLYKAIQVTIVDKKKHDISLKNFTTFLNNLPDADEIRESNFKLIKFDTFVSKCKDYSSKARSQKIV